MTHTKDEALKMALEEIKELVNQYVQIPKHHSSAKTLTILEQALAAQPAPVQDCFWKREGYKECPAAQPAVPDALTSADIQENIEYVAGWNDCRQAMLEMMK
jgi:hypothetical protein